MHITTKSFILRYFCPPGDFKVRLKVTKRLFLGGKMEFLLKSKQIKVLIFIVLCFNICFKSLRYVVYETTVKKIWL